jgi:hypothetical protein
VKLAERQQAMRDRNLKARYKKISVALRLRGKPQRIRNRTKNALAALKRKRDARILHRKLTQQETR